jgi:hypothetical protein
MGRKNFFEQKELDKHFSIASNNDIIGDEE